MTVIDVFRPSTVPALRRRRGVPSADAAALGAQQLAVVRWRRATIAVGALASAVTTVLVHVAGIAGRFGDEPSHLLHARRVFDSLTPGFGQLGNYWPPLIHWAQLPFAWNSWLVQHDLSGQLAAMGMFVVAVWGAFELGRELTGRPVMGAVSAAVLVVNPNMLYLASSTMMESGIVMALTWVAVWLLRFHRTGHLRDVAIAGMWSAVAVFATWAALILPLYGGLVVMASARRHGFSWPKARTFIAAYALFPAYAVGLWLGWNWFIQGDPFYMVDYRLTEHGTPVSTDLVRVHPDAAHGAMSLMSAVLDNVGPAVFLLGLVALVVGIARRQLLHPLGVTLLGGALMLVEWAAGHSMLVGSPTFAFLQTLSGGDAIGLNVRYGLWVLPFLAGAAALVAHHRRFGAVTAVVLVAATVAWYLPAMRGVVTLRSDDRITVQGERTAQEVAAAIRDRYDGGKVLTSAAVGGDRIIWLSGLPVKDFVTEFNPVQFTRAVRDPGAAVSYVLRDKRLAALVPVARLQQDGFHQIWQGAVDGNGLSIWTRNHQVAR